MYPPGRTRYQENRLSNLLGLFSLSETRLEPKRFAIPPAKRCFTDGRITFIAPATVLLETCFKSAVATSQLGQGRVSDLAEFH